MLLTNNERAEEVVEGCVCFVPNCCCVVSVCSVVVSVASLLFEDTQVHHVSHFSSYVDFGTNR